MKKNNEDTLKEKHAVFLRDAALSLMNTNQFQAAIETFNQSLAYEENWLTYQRLGLVLVKTNQFQEAIEAFNQSLAIEENWFTYQNLGLALYRSNQFDAAIEVFFKSLALQENWFTYQVLGLVLYLTNQFEAAIRSFNKSLADEENWFTYQVLGLVFLKTNQLQTAIEKFYNSIALQENWDTYKSLGLALSKMDLHQEAIEVFNKSLVLEENWETYKNLGSALLKTDQFQAAIEAFNKSLVLDENWETYKNLGSALLKTDQFQAAIEAFKKSLALEENWEAYKGLGLALSKMDLYQEAIEAFNKSLVLEENWETYKILGLTLSKINQFQTAIEAIYRWNYLKPSNIAEKIFQKIFLENIANKDDAQLLDLFLKAAISGEINKSIAILLGYISKKCRGGYLNPLLIRQVSNMLPSLGSQRTQCSVNSTCERIDQLRVGIDKQNLQFTSKRKFVFGVSHARIYIECHGFKVIDCAAGTMHGIGNTNSKAQHYHTIQLAIKDLDPQETCLVFEFAEIDIRNHIFKQSKKRSENPYRVIDNTVSRYFSFLDSLKYKGFTIIVSGPHCGGGNVPGSTSSEVERNDLCAYMNDKLASECHVRGMSFCTMFDVAVDQITLKQVSELYTDHHHFHLSELQTNTIGIALSNLASARVNSASKDYIFLNTPFHKSDVTAHCKIIASNIPNWDSGSVYAPGKVNNGEMSWVDGETLIALIELPFGMKPKEIFLDFQGQETSLSTSIQAVNELYDLSKEFERSNIINSLDSSQYSQKTTTITHFFSDQMDKDNISRFIILRVFSNSQSTKLISIRFKRWIDNSQKK
jgi:tetratricopeptide (TPR) repeat protein